MRKVEGEAKHIDEGQKEFIKERSEYPTLSEKTIMQIVQDHSKKKSVKHRLASHWAKHKCNANHFKKRKALVKHWKVLKAKHSGLAQIPADYTKRLDGENLHHYGPKLPDKREAQHSKIGMDDYAELDIAFLKEGWFADNSGIEYYYPWEIIDRDKDVFKDVGFFINHADTSGTEMGITSDIYEKNIDGTTWLCGKIKIPEKQFTQSFLDRIETGLIKDVSSTHEFKVDPNDENKRVLKITKGKGISTVTEGEVPGAMILDIKRHIKSN
jgi:hypothetical protein